MLNDGIKALKEFFPFIWKTDMRGIFSSFIGFIGLKRKEKKLKRLYGAPYHKSVHELKAKRLSDVEIPVSYLNVYTNMITKSCTGQ